MNNFSKFKRILLILLSLSILFSTLSACRLSGNTKNNSSIIIANNSSSSQDQSSSSSTESSSLSSVEPSSDSIDDDNTGDVTETVELSVHNNSEPINTHFSGFSGTVYNCFPFMRDNYGRNYSDTYAKIEFDRIQSSGYKYVRSMFKTTYAWDAKTQAWNWDSDSMQAVYKWAKELQKRNIQVILSMGYVISDFATGKASWMNECAYVRGQGNDIYGESAYAGINFKGMSEDEIRLQKSACRYSEWVCQALTKGFKAHGINNIEYLLCFTEPEDKYAEEYIKIVSRLNKTMQTKGIRNQYSIIGPNQGVFMNGTSQYTILTKVLEYMQNTGEKLVDIVSDHQYSTQQDSVSPMYGYSFDEHFSQYMSYCDLYGFKGEFWLDEFNVSISGQLLGEDVPWRGTQFGVALARSMNLGISNTIVWQAFNQLWPNHTGTSGEFVKGVHSTGLAPSLFISSIPFTQYYSSSMLARNFGSKNGTVYQTDDDWSSGISSSCCKLEDGTWVVLVVNSSYGDVNFEMTFEKALGVNMYRHLYNPETIVPTAEAYQIEADKGFRSVRKKLIDTVPIGGVAVYTSHEFSD